MRSMFYSVHGHARPKSTNFGCGFFLDWLTKLTILAMSKLILVNSLKPDVKKIIACTDHLSLFIMDEARPIEVGLGSLYSILHD